MSSAICDPAADAALLAARLAARPADRQAQFADRRPDTYRPDAVYPSDPAGSLVARSAAADRLSAQPVRAAPRGEPDCGARLSMAIEPGPIRKAGGPAADRPRSRLGPAADRGDGACARARLHHSRHQPQDRPRRRPRHHPRGRRRGGGVDGRVDRLGGAQPRHVALAPRSGWPAISASTSCSA